MKRVLAYAFLFFATATAMAQQSPGKFRELNLCPQGESLPYLHYLDERREKLRALQKNWKSELERVNQQQPSLDKVRACGQFRARVVEFQGSVREYLNELAKARSALSQLGEKKCVEDLKFEMHKLEDEFKGFTADLEAVCSTSR